MPEGSGTVINKKEIGERIKRLRKDAGLRQWQLAEMVGATQPAIHMYERGVLPEPKRLLELARIGNTSVEWILTGRHWEDGSSEMPRASAEVFNTAFQLTEYGEEDREALDSALEVINSAVDAVKKGSKTDITQMSVEEVARRLKDMAGGSLQALNASLDIHESIQKKALEQATQRLRRAAGRMGAQSGEERFELTSAGAATGRSRRVQRTRANSIEPLRGHIFRMDGSLLVIKEILSDKDLRAEFEESIAKLSGKLESKRSKVLKMRRAQRGK